MGSERYTVDTSLADFDIAYFSLLVPEGDAAFETEALHRTGNSFMRSLLGQLRKGAPSSLRAVSAPPVPAFPKSKRLWVRGREIQIDRGLVGRHLGFPNVTPIKQVWVGLAVLFYILRWAPRQKVGRVRVVFSYNTSMPHILFTFLGARIVGATIVAFIGDVYVPGHTAPDTFWHRVDFALQKRLLRKLDAIVVVAERIAHDLAPDTPRLILEGAIPDAVLKATAMALSERSREESTFVITATGSLTPYNGVSAILEAFALLADPTYRLVIAGRGPDEKLVRERATLDQRITFLGYLSHDDLLKVHARADVLISMRISTGLLTQYAFPSKTFEYLCSGVPMITTATGHMAEEFGDYAVVLKTDSAEALAAAIESVAALTREQRDIRGQKARQFIVETKTWDAQGRRLRQFLCAVVAANASR